VPHPTDLDDAALLADCELEFLRRSGPGGQHRNKTETAVVLRHAKTGLSAEANERRSQADNRSVALFRLRLSLAVNLREHVAVDASPSQLWASRCKNQRISVASAHADFPRILAEALDRLHANDHRLDAAAEQLQVTNSQLIKLFKQHPPALLLVNRQRQAKNLGPLK
jgi:protein subunit release factor A